MHLDHEKLDVCQVSLEFAGRSFALAETLDGFARHARDPLLRVSQSISLNIAEGNGKRVMRERARFWDIARGSATECAAIFDILNSAGHDARQDIERDRALLARIAARLTRMIRALDAQVREEQALYGIADAEQEGVQVEHE